MVYNVIHLAGFVKKILDLEPVTDKLKSFGWPVLEVTGHDIAQVDKALDQAEATKGAPTFIVAHTVKGKGASFMENEPEWHGKAPQPDEAARGSTGRAGAPRRGRRRGPERGGGVRGGRGVAGAPLPAWAAPVVAELSALGKK